MPDITALVDAVEPTKWTRVKVRAVSAKNYVVEHKVEFGIGAVLIILAAVVGYEVGSRKKDDEDLETPSIEGDVSFLSAAVGCYKPIINNVDYSTTIHNAEPVKRLSYIIKEGDRTWETQHEYAEEMGVSDSHLSSYLNGKKAAIGDLNPVRLGVRSES